jgi:hypothetical protein
MVEKENFICCILVKELSTMHDKHLNRPTLDDNIDEEQTIEITTKEITQVSNHIRFYWQSCLFALSPKIHIPLHILRLVNIAFSLG